MAWCHVSCDRRVRDFRAPDRITPLNVPVPSGTKSRFVV
jgi:hypothetical protein